MKTEISLEEFAKSLLESHECIFIRMTDNFRVEWENKLGILRNTDLAFLSNLNEAAWNYFKNH